MEYCFYMHCYLLTLGFLYLEVNCLFYIFNAFFSWWFLHCPLLSQLKYIYRRNLLERMNAMLRMLGASSPHWIIRECECFDLCLQKYGEIFHTAWARLRVCLVARTLLFFSQILLWLISRCLPKASDAHKLGFGEWLDHGQVILH